MRKMKRCNPRFCRFPGFFPEESHDNRVQGITFKLCQFTTTVLALRHTVAAEQPICLPIAANERFLLSSSNSRESDTAAWGRPSFFPFALALRIPARTRSAIKLRSSSATAPRTVKIIFPVGVLVSICSENEQNSMPRLLNVSSARRR